MVGNIPFKRPSKYLFDYLDQRARIRDRINRDLPEGDEYLPPMPKWARKQIQFYQLQEREMINLGLLEEWFPKKAKAEFNWKTWDIPWFEDSIRANQFEYLKKERGVNKTNSTPESKENENLVTQYDGLRGLRLVKTSEVEIQPKERVRT